MRLVPIRSRMRMINVAVIMLVVAVHLTGPVDSDRQIGDNQQSLINIIYKMYNRMNRMDKLMNKTAAQFDAIESEIRQIKQNQSKIVETDEHFKDKIESIESEIRKIKQNQSKIVETVEHFKDINGTKVFDLVISFNEFKNKLGDIESITNDVANAPFVYYPRYTKDNIAKKQYKEYNLTFDGYGRQEWWYSHQRAQRVHYTKRRVSLEACFKFCQRKPKWWGIKSVTYDARRTCRCHPGSRNVLIGNDLRYVFY